MLWLNSPILVSPKPNEAWFGLKNPHWQNNVPLYMYFADRSIFLCIRYSQLNKQILCKDKHWFGLGDIYSLNHSQGSIRVYNCRQLNVMHPCINSIIIKCNSIRVGTICQTPDQMLSELYSLQTRSVIRLCSVSTVYYICRVSGLLKLLKKIDKKKIKI